MDPDTILHAAPALAKGAGALAAAVPFTAVVKRISAALGTGPQDTWNFATYWADSATGLDYANNRYYSNAYGRFMTPDPFGGSAKPGNPQSWNKYAYAWDDPVNELDPTGFVPHPQQDCAKMLATINRRVYGTTDDSIQPTGGLVQKFFEQIFGNYPPGTTEWRNHNNNIQTNQTGLKALLKKFYDDKCPPPSNWKNINFWIYRPLPTQQDYKGPPTQFFMIPLPVIEDILELLPELAMAGGQATSVITTVDDAISYDMSPYLDDGDGVTSVNDFITYDMSPYLGSSGVGGDDGGADLFQQTSDDEDE
jgi:RHS repeat-associated protein